MEDGGFGFRLPATVRRSNSATTESGPEGRALLLASGASARRRARDFDKRLPVASGIGGGSADAAAALRLLTSLWGIDPKHAQAVAPELGSDVPACLLSLPMRGEGAGDQLTPVDLSDCRERRCCWSIRACSCRPRTCSPAWDRRTRRKSEARNRHPPPLRRSADRRQCRTRTPSRSHAAHREPCPDVQRKVELRRGVLAGRSAQGAALARVRPLVSLALTRAAT